MKRTPSLLILAFFCLAACTNEDKTIELNEGIVDVEVGKVTSEFNAIQFPEILQLTYSLIQLSVLEESSPDQSLEYLQSFSIGSIQDKKATLHVYKEHDESKRCGLNYETTSFVEFDNRIHQLPECTSTNFSNQDPGYFVQLYQVENSSPKILQAGIELAANGAGRTLFLIFDRSNEQWLAFEAWGIPVIKESSQAYADTFIFDFPGLHMKGSDISFYRWNNGNLEKSDSVSEVLGFYDGYFVQSALAPSETEIVIEVKVTSENGLEFEVEYKYEDDKLFKKTS